MAQLSKDTILGHGDKTINLWNELTNQERQTVQLTHGVNVLETDQASPLDAVLYGRTLVNLLGSGYSTEKTFVADGTNSYIETYNLNSGDYRIFLIEVKTDTSGDVRFYDGTQYLTYSLIAGEYKTITIKIPSTSTIIRFQEGTIIGNIYYKKARIYSVGQEISDKIGVSLTDEDVERMFPYVDGVQHVRNPMVEVTGKNLIPPFTDSRWDLHANAKVISPYELELDATGSNQITRISIPIASGQSISFSRKNNEGRYAYRWYDASGSPINALTVLLGHNGALSGVTTAPANASTVQVSLYNDTSTTGKFRFKQPMINLGDTATPFTPYNPSHLYADVTLAGNDTVQDTLYQQDGQWYKRKAWDTNVVLDGSWNWNASSLYNYSGFKRTTVNGFFMKSASSLDLLAVMFNGDILKTVTSSEIVDGAEPDRVAVGDENRLDILVSNVDTGFSQELVPTRDLFKAYFNGWRYTGDGVAHSWVSIVDGSAPAEQTTAYVSTNMAEGYTPYKLNYQLAEPVTEPVTVEGDLSITGSSQIEVGEGVVFREVASVDLGEEVAFINFRTSALHHKTKEILGVYKHGERDEKWETINIPSSNVNYPIYGAKYARIFLEDYDPTAEYTVTYTILDKYATTAPLTRVDATYQQSLKSAFDRTVAKQSDIATSVTVNTNALVDVYARLKAIENS